jgi:predicted PurR-regulated permease PerM
MTLSEKNKNFIIDLLPFVLILVLLFFIGEILLPFILALFIAYLLNPIILKIQKKIKNRTVATTSFLLLLTLLFVSATFFFGGHIINDSKRLVNAVEVFTQKNEHKIEEVKNSALFYLGKINENEYVKGQLEELNSGANEVNQEDVMSSIKSVYSFFQQKEPSGEEEITNSWSSIYMLFYTLLYVFFILYTYDYFEGKYQTYFANRKTVNSRLKAVFADFNIVFVNYFKQRGKLVLINLLICTVAFSILDLPGAIIIGILTGVLSYASQFHYLSLPLASISCWVLSVEQGHNFFIYFGIVLFIYVLISILEETIYEDKIMKSVNGMNPAVIVLSFALWVPIFGGFNGTILALPLTQLILIYLDRVLLYSDKAKLSEEVVK